MTPLVREYGSASYVPRARQSAWPMKGEVPDGVVRGRQTQVAAAVPQGIELR